MEDSGKFIIEAQSILLNLKISLQEFEKDPDDKENLDALLELFNQLGSICGLYGANSVLKLSNSLTAIFEALREGKIEFDDALTDKISGSEEILSKLIKDPLLKDSGLKNNYNSLITSLNQILASNIEKTTQEDSFKLANAKFQEVFMEEAFDLINQLEEKMLQLEIDPNDEEMIDSVFRIMHTLKGNSNMFGYKHLGEITHQLENIYDAIRSKKLELSRAILEITLQCFDHFRNLMDDSELSNMSNRKRQTQMLEDIQAILSNDQISLVSSSKKKKKTSKEICSFYLYFKPEAKIFDDGTNPMYFVSDLHDIGKCLVVPFIEDLTDSKDYNPEKCFTLWHILLVTDASEEEVHEHFLFLNERSQPKIKMIANEDVLAFVGFSDYFLNLSQQKEIIGTINIQQFQPGKTEDVNAKSDSSQHNASMESISSVRVASFKIDLMMNLISELVTKQAELNLIASEYQNSRLQEVAENIENISRELRDNAFSISLIPIEKSVLRFQRLVRDVSNRFNKKVEFVVNGKETELDKNIIEKIIDPIMHILRNSIDHGIEMPEERLRKGKPAMGRITLDAFPSGANVVIEISDDGAGINLDKVRQTAVNKGYIGENERPDRQELINLIVSPGFSTAENISEVSGRGVGMDVVSRKISEIRGELEIETQKDKGTKISIRLPLTISIIDSLLAKIAGDYYLVPLALVDHCAEVKSEQIVNSASKYMVLNNEYVPYVDLRTEFEITGKRPPSEQVILVKYKDTLVGIIVDEVIGNYQAVLKTMGVIYRHQEIVSGASILGTGEVALVLDTNKIIQEYATLNEQRLNATI